MYGKILKAEKDVFFTGGIYQLTKALLASNSEQLEGSTITYFETKRLLENKPVEIESEAYKTEMLNHFKLFDYMIDTYEAPLSSELIKEYHRILKAGAKAYDKGTDVKIGDWKSLPNTIGGVIPTAEPEQVDDAMFSLLVGYENKGDKTLKDILDFHYQFEAIHPFYDGNGRVGRMIMFKECLRNDITPYIISLEDRADYGKALRSYPIDGTLLKTIAQKNQDVFVKNTRQYELEF